MEGCSAVDVYPGMNEPPHQRNPHGNTTAEFSFQRSTASFRLGLLTMLVIDLHRVVKNKQGRQNLIGGQ